MNAATVCALLWLVGGATTPMPAHRLATCKRVAIEAEAAKVPRDVLLAQAWTESRFNNHRVGKAGEISALQVLPRYHCPNRVAKGCDGIRRGATLHARLRRKYGDRRALAVYNAGPRNWRAGLRYARKIQRLARRLKQARLRWKPKSSARNAAYR